MDANARDNIARSLRSVAASLASDVMEVRRRHDGALGRMEHYQTGIAALGAGIDELLRMAKALECGDVLRHIPVMPGEHGDLDGGELVTACTRQLTTW